MALNGCSDGDKFCWRQTSAIATQSMHQSSSADGPFHSGPVYYLLCSVTTSSQYYINHVTLAYILILFCLILLMLTFPFSMCLFLHAPIVSAFYNTLLYCFSIPIIPLLSSFLPIPLLFSCASLTVIHLLFLMPHMVLS